MPVFPLPLWQPDSTANASTAITVNAFLRTIRISVHLPLAEVAMRVPLRVHS